jgi:hypothetical protein
MSENTKKIKPIPGKAIEIPPEGALGIMALGYKGVQMWRKVRDEAMAKADAEKGNNDNLIGSDEQA